MDHCVYVEHCAEFSQQQYVLALDNLVGGNNIIHLNKMNGHVLVDLATKALADRLIEEGLEIEDTLLKTYPSRKRAERVIVTNLPFFVEDAEVTSALKPHGQVKSIAPLLVNVAGFTMKDGRRELFILLNEGVKLERLSTRLNINHKGEILPAFLVYGVNHPKGWPGTWRCGFPDPTHPSTSVSPTLEGRLGTHNEPPRHDTQREGSPLVTEALELFHFLAQNHVDIAFIQERNKESLDYAQDLCLGYSAIVAPPAASRGSGLACHFVPGFALLRHRVLWPGCIDLVHLDVHGHKRAVINCHLSHAPHKRLEQLGSSPAAGSPGVAVVLKSAAAIEHLSSYIEDVEWAAEDLEDGELWSGWNRIKAEILAEIRSLHTTRPEPEDDYVTRASRYIRARLEASSTEADYPSLPDLGRALRIRRGVATIVRNEEGEIMGDHELRSRALSFFRHRFAQDPADPAEVDNFIAGTTTHPRSRRSSTPVRHLQGGNRCSHPHASHWKSPGRVLGASLVRGALPSYTRRGSICLVPKARSGPDLSYPDEVSFLEHRSGLGRGRNNNCGEVAAGGRIGGPGVRFDSLDRGFLMSLQVSLGLPPALIRWIQLLYAGANAAVRIGDHHTAAFPLLNGVRQGCAVSAALFSLATIPLLRRLQSALGEGKEEHFDAISVHQGVKTALRGGLSAYSWLSESGAWLTPLPPRTWLPARRQRLLGVWEAASKILALNHRVLPPNQLLGLTIIRGCRFLRPPDLIAASHWVGARVGDLTGHGHPIFASPADEAALSRYTSRLLEENCRGSYRVNGISEAIVLRGTATPLQRLTTRTARRMLERPRLAALPITQLLGRWLPHVSIPISISWSSLRRAHPASARESCIACGSGDLPLAPRYWSCRRIRPVIVEAFTIIQRSPDLKTWIFGHDLEDYALAIMASAKTRIYKYFLALEHGQKAHPCAEKYANFDLQSKRSINLRTVEKYANSPAGGKDANSATSADFAIKSPFNGVIEAQRNWANSSEDVNSVSEDCFTVVQGKKRRRGSAESPAAAAHSSNARRPGTNRRQRSSTERVPRAQEINTTRTHIVEARARQASSTEEQCLYVEHCPELEPYHYLKAIDEMVGGTSDVVQIAKVNGHLLLGLFNKALADRLINEGLEVEGMSLKTFPFYRRAVRITIGNLPFFVKDASVIDALLPYGRVTSIVPKQLKAGKYVYTDGRREAFIVPHDGMTIESIPARLDIRIKGEAWPMYLTSGIRCSRCRGQGHRRVICPLLTGQSTGPRRASPPFTTNVSQITAPELPRQASAASPAPSPPDPAMRFPALFLRPQPRLISLLYLVNPMATPPPPPSVRMEDDPEPDYWTDMVDPIDELMRSPGSEPILRTIDVFEFVDAARDPEVRECVVADLSPRQKKIVAQFLDKLIERTRDSVPLIRRGLSEFRAALTSYVPDPP
ncbi:hypothetical protein LAZ67_2003043 [Cordylochernes scorpioides]|uniref:Reverse transcriptase n=1 Tax=Cordylochernes scorpioides TaxID=51811 RepID=A0ABY6K2J2_9ARAC|nr:hypothetical protein LAZ67_2003043 [Cordylochernes scorpioides]